MIKKSNLQKIPLILIRLWNKLISYLYNKKSDKSNTYNVPDPRLNELISILGKEDAEFFVKGDINGSKS